MKRKHKLLKGFKERWERVGVFEENELRKMSIEQKFHQVASLIRTGLGLGVDFNEDKEKLKTRSRWAFLKKGIR